MTKKSLCLVALLSLVLIDGLFEINAYAHGDLGAVVEAQMYNRAIHIMAMLLLGSRLRPVGFDGHLHDGRRFHTRIFYH